LDNGAVAKAAAHVQPPDFELNAHRLAFAAMLAMHGRGEPLDLVTLAAEMQERGDLAAAGGPEGLSRIMDGATTSANVEAHARLVAKRSRQRKVRAAAAELANGPSRAPEEVQASVDRMAQAAKATDAARAPLHVSHKLDRLFTQGPQPALPLGLDCLRDLEVNPGHMLTVGARPGEGKTAFLGTVALAASREEWDVLFLSLEMPSLEIQQRLAAGIGGIPLGEVKRAENPDLLKAVKHLQALSIWVEDGNEEPRIALDLEGIGALVRAFAASSDNPRKAVLVDYLQFVRTRARFERRHEAVAHICRELKRLAVSANVALVVAAQLSRAVEQRGKDAKPQMADLAESSEAEKTSDKILFIHRDKEVEGRTLLRVAKNRQGPCWASEAYFNGPLCLFYDQGGDWR